MVEPLPAAELGQDPKPPQCKPVLSALLRRRPGLSTTQGLRLVENARPPPGKHSSPAWELQGDNLSWLLCAKGFCLPHPKGSPWEEIEKVSDASLPFEVEASLLLPWSQGDRSQSQAAVPRPAHPRPLTTCLPHATQAVGSPLGCSPATQGLEGSFKPPTPNRLSHFRKVLLPPKHGVKSFMMELSPEAPLK